MWVIEVREEASGEAVSLPASEDWHASLKLLSALAAIYGSEAVALYQWDISRVYADRHEL
jgi:hypothetical protein